MHSKEFLNKVKEFIEMNGFDSFIDSSDPTFVKKIGKVVYSVFFNVYSDDSITLGNFQISFVELEDNFLELGLPQMDLTNYSKKKKYFLTTLEHRIIENPFRERSIKSSVEVEKCIEQFKSIYYTQLQTLESRFQSLHDVYEFIQDREDWNIVLTGMGSNYIKRLVLFREFNDPRYDEELVRLDEQMSIHDVWSEYWKKYKAHFNLYPISK